MPRLRDKNISAQYLPFFFSSLISSPVCGVSHFKELGNLHGAVGPFTIDTEKVTFLKVQPGGSGGSSDRLPGGSLVSLPIFIIDVEKVIFLGVDTMVGLHVFGGEYPLAHIQNQPSSVQFNSSELS